MSIRIIEYTVTPDTISPAGIRLGGVQGEHRACKLNFKLNDALTNALIAKKSEGSFSYRFDAVDAAGERIVGMPTVFNADEKGEFSYYLENFLTKRAGIIEVYFIITLSNGTATEMEIVAHSVKLSLKATVGDTQEEYESFSTLGSLLDGFSETAKESSQIAVDAAKKAEQLCEETKAAAVAFGEDAEWVFEGGNAYSNIGINYAVEDKVNEDSTNPVTAKAISEFVSAKLEERLSASGENIVESHIYKGGSFAELYVIKRKNGIAELYGITEPLENIKFDHIYGALFYTSIEFTLPETVFNDKPIWADIKTLSGNGLLFCSIKSLDNNKISAYFSNSIQLEPESFKPQFMIRAIGKWKEQENE